MKNMNRSLVVTRSFLALMTSVVAMLATEANGQWSDNFDSYANESTIIGQGAWAGWELAESGVNDTFVTNEQANSGAHSLIMGGTPYVDVIPQFDGVTEGMWSFEAMTYVPDDSDEGITDVGFLSRHLGFQDADSTQWFGAFRLNMAEDFAGAPNGEGVPIIRDQWVKIQTIFDIDERTYESFYNGEFTNIGTWNGDYALVGLDVWSEDNSSTMYYDDFKVAPVVDAVPGDFDGDGALGLGDIDLLQAEIKAGGDNVAFDVNGDGALSADDLGFFVTDASKLNTWIGDSNLDGEFNSGDFVQVFTAGKYETVADATWAEGDWDGDGVFNSADFVSAFSNGGYELGPKAAAAAVPEPASLIAVLLAGLVMTIVFRRK